MTDLVRVQIGGIEKNVGRGFAERHKLPIINESTEHRGGRPRQATRSGGRQMKRKTSVAAAAAEKQKTASTEDASTPEEAPQ